jgi:hypothetical protein
MRLISNIALSLLSRNMDIVYIETYFKVSLNSITLKADEVDPPVALRHIGARVGNISSKDLYLAHND